MSFEWYYIANFDFATFVENYLQQISFDDDDGKCPDRGRHVGFSDLQPDPLEPSVIFDEVAAPYALKKIQKNKKLLV